MSPVEAVEDWVQRLVVAQNFCPFAAKPFAEGRVQIQEILGSDTEAMLLKCHSFLESFVSEGSNETVLFVLPKGVEDFMDYLDMADAFEMMLEDSFEGDLSLATFHPDYQFAEFPPSDVVHHIQRAPHPVLHVLREDSIDKVRSSMGDTTDITARNHEHAKTLGVEFFEKFLPG